MHDLGAPIGNNGIRDNFMGQRMAPAFGQRQEPAKQVQFAAGPVQ